MKTFIPEAISHNLLNGIKDGSSRISYYSFIISAILLIGNVSCGKDEDIPQPVSVVASSITLNQTSVTMKVGETFQLTAFVSPDNATNKTITWLSSDDNIATVKDGQITANEVGLVYITAQCGNIIAKCSVTVKETEATSILLNKTSVKLSPGETFQLTATVSPDNTTDKSVTWASSDTSVASVIDGNIIAQGVGTATITAQCGAVRADCWVTVKSPEVKSIQLNQTSVTLYPGETVRLTATVSPDNATNKTVIWTSSDTNIATIIDGIVVAKSVGMVTISARCGSAIAECSIIVKAIEPSSIQLNKTSVTVFPGEVIQLIATVLPENATNKTVTWSSSNTNIATVSDGKVRAISVGTAKITAQSGSFKAECLITVKAIEVSSIQLNRNSVMLSLGESFQLTATVLPENATNKTVTWSSSNTNIATVSDGKVKAMAVGTAKITVQSGNVKADCLITVKAIEVTSIQLNQNSVKMNAGETIQLTATLSPYNATNKNVTWSSSNTNIVSVSNGKVSAISAGSASIMAHTSNGLSAKCDIVVVDVVTPGDNSIETFRVNGVSFDMIKVNGGTFKMGSNDGNNNEKPIHSEIVRTFYIGKTEVTQGLWKAVMGSNPSFYQGDNLPVETVSYFDCMDFISRLNKLTGLTFRLPSEAEWEYAAKGGDKSAGYMWSGSDDIYRIAWFNEISGNMTHPNAMKFANELGIFDMSGNVWEWCSDDWRGNYSSPSNSSSRVIRGGSWNCNAFDCRVTIRKGSSPASRTKDLGLRLVL